MKAIVHAALVAACTACASAGAHFTALPAKSPFIAAAVNGHVWGASSSRAFELRSDGSIVRSFNLPKSAGYFVAVAGNEPWFVAHGLMRDERVATVATVNGNRVTVLHVPVKEPALSIAARGNSLYMSMNRYLTTVTPQGHTTRALPAACRGATWLAAGPTGLWLVSQMGAVCFLPSSGPERWVIRHTEAFQLGRIAATDDGGAWASATNALLRFYRDRDHYDVVRTGNLHPVAVSVGPRRVWFAATFQNAIGSVDEKGRLHITVGERVDDLTALPNGTVLCVGREASVVFQCGQ